MPGARVNSGKRVTLRTAETEDIPFLQRARANPELRYPLGNPTMDQEQFEEWREGKSGDQFLVCLDEDEITPGQPDENDVRQIGQVNVHGADHNRPELGSWLIPEVHGEGYGKESASLLIDYVFRAYDTPVVGAETYDFNEASRGLLESLGFVKEGRRRKFKFVNGAYRDVIQYSLLREEW